MSGVWSKLDWIVPLVYYHVASLAEKSTCTVCLKEESPMLWNLVSILAICPDSHA